MDVKVAMLNDKDATLDPKNAALLAGKATLDVKVAILDPKNAALLVFDTIG